MAAQTYPQISGNDPDVPVRGLAQGRAQALGTSCVSWVSYPTSLGLICCKKMINSTSKGDGKTSI